MTQTAIGTISDEDRAYFTRTLVCVCADSVSQLRGCDVHRVVYQADLAGKRDAFAAWLREERPDLKAKIAMAIEFIEEDIAEARAVSPR